MKELIRAGARLDSRDSDGCAPVHLAAHCGNLPALQELMRAGSNCAWVTDANQTCIHLASFIGAASIVSYLIDKYDADPGTTDVVGHTPLANAAQAGHVGVVKVLIRRGVDRLGRAAFRDALGGAAMAGNAGMIRVLLDAEGSEDVKTAKTTMGRSALHYAAGYCHPLCTQMLLDAGQLETDGDSRLTPIDLIDTMRSPYVSHGVGRRRVRHMLMQGPAYRALSWRWPNAGVDVHEEEQEEADAAESERDPTASEIDAAESELDAAESERDAVESAGEPPELEEMSEDDFDGAFAAAHEAAAAAAARLNVNIYRRRREGTAAVDCGPMFVADIIR